MEVILHKYVLFKVSTGEIESPSAIKLYNKNKNNIHKDIFACLFSIHNTISLSCHEQVCLKEQYCEIGKNEDFYFALMKDYKEKHIFAVSYY